MTGSMKALALAVVIGAAFGCSNTEVVKRVEALADEACACKDAACADEVEKKYTAMVEEGQKRGSSEDLEKVQEAFGRMTTCLAKARAQGGVDTGAATGTETGTETETGTGTETETGTGTETETETAP